MMTSFALHILKLAQAEQEMCEFEQAQTMSASLAQPSRSSACGFYICNKPSCGLLFQDIASKREHEVRHHANH